MYVTAFAKISTEHGEKKTSSGAIAQLGEHLLCKQGVGGSIPPGSTSSKENKGVEASCFDSFVLSGAAGEKFFNNLEML